MSNSNSITPITTLEEIKKLDTNELIEFLKGQEVLHLIKEDFDIINDERITGYIFLDMTQKDFLSYGLKRGPASSLAKFAKECKEQKFFSDKNVKELMREDQLLVEKENAIEELERRIIFGSGSDIGQQGNQFMPNTSGLSGRKIKPARSRRR